MHTGLPLIRFCLYFTALGFRVRSAAVWGLSVRTGRCTNHVFMCTLVLRTREEWLGFHPFSKRKSRKERKGEGKGLEGKRDK